MEYTARYGLEFDPFLKNSKEIFVPIEDHKETLTRLNHLAKSCGFGLLTGAPGVGKTTVTRTWARSLNPSLFKVIYSSLSTLTVNEFYAVLARNLGLEARYRKSDNFRAIQDEINRLALEKRITPVIIMDEANSLKHAALNDLKMLFNFEMDSKDRAVVLLVGLPQMNSILNLGIHEPLRQRIVMNYNLEGMSKEEGRAYIRAKLDGAHCQQQVFDDAALEVILNSANGVARLIGRFCSSCLLVGDSLKADIIDALVANKAIGDCDLA